MPGMSFTTVARSDRDNKLGFFVFDTFLPLFGTQLSAKADSLSLFHSVATSAFATLVQTRQNTEESHIIYKTMTVEPTATVSVDI